MFNPPPVPEFEPSKKGVKKAIFPTKKEAKSRREGPESENENSTP